MSNESFVVCLIPCITCILFLIELCLALIDAANDKQHEVRQMIMTSLHGLGKKQPEMVLSAIKGYLIKHQKVHKPSWGYLYSWA